MNKLLIAPKSPKARQILARRWCELNLHHWPTNTSIKQPEWFGNDAWANNPSRTVRFIDRTMRLIEKAIGREECLREWNSNVAHPKPADLLRPQINPF